MLRRLDYLQAANGDLVGAKGMSEALTAATLVFGDSASQTSRPESRRARACSAPGRQHRGPSDRGPHSRRR